MRRRGEVAAWAALAAGAVCAADLERLPVNNPGATADLAVGLWAWPLPIDIDGDGAPDYVGGAEDGHFCFLRNPRAMGTP